MSVTFFPINDLLRRKTQTALAVVNITLCIASTLFLLLFAEKIGFGVALAVENRLTVGLSAVFSRFIIFIGFLIFAIGAIIVSFTVFVMMSQKTKDIGLIRATGCPNDMVFGYFMTELLIVTLISCFLGVVLGVVADFAVTNLFSSLGFPISLKPANVWIVLLVFIAFFIFALTFGTKPVLDTTKIESAKAISPNYYLGLSKETSFKASRTKLVPRIALRSLFRRKSATFRVVLCLSTIFVLATVTVAGGIIADQTTKSWIEKAVGKDTVLIAHKDISNQYKVLSSKFYEAQEEPPINYTDEKYLLNDDIASRLSLLPEIEEIEMRLITKARVKEVPGYVIDPESGVISTVGDSHEGESLIVGVDPAKTLGEWFLTGEFLNENDTYEAVIGDSISQTMFSMPLNQSMRFLNNSFDVKGVCFDPVNNGKVAYVPLKTLQSITDTPKCNIAIAKIAFSADHKTTLNQLRGEIAEISSDLEIVEFNEILDKSLGFLDYIWSTITFLPLFSLAAAALSLIGYVVLAIAEQRQELGVLRALGAKPATIVKIIALQSLIVLLASCAVGISIGTMATLLILVQKPLVTGFTILEIAALLFASLIVTFVFSLYPAVKFARTPILKTMAQH